MKKVNKVLVVVMAMILTLAMGITAFADFPGVKKFGKVTYSKTMYTNDSAEGNYTISFAYTAKSSETPKFLVTSSDRSILKITKIENTNGIVKVSVQALSDGKATVTVTDQYNTKKSKKVKVTVKTLQASVTFGDNVTSTGTNKDGVSTYTVSVNAAGKTTLGTTIVNATGKKLKYEAVGNAKKVASVTAKGVVTAKKTAGSSAVYNVVANDEKTNKGTVLAQVTINVVNAASSNKPTIGGSTKAVKQALKTNLSATNHTYAIKVDNYSVSDLTFTSNKPAVAEVDANGTVTAKSNGKATITVASKLNSKLAIKVNVTVTTDVDVITTAFKTASIVADGKSTLSILGATNQGASVSKVKYTVFDDNNNKVKGVSVSSKGIVKVKKTCTVDRFYVTVASKNGSYKQTVTINVVKSTKATAVTVNGNSGKSQKISLKITGNEPTVVTYKASTDSKDNDGITWTNSNSAVADVVTYDNGKTITITAKSVGKTKLVATAADGSKKKQTITLTVTKEAVASGEINVYLKEKATLPSGNWTVADKKIAKISKGVLTGNKVGSTTITNGTTTYTVNVGPKPDTVQKNINKILTNTIKAENRTWMGISPALNTKTNTIDITITNPDQDVTELTGTGLTNYLTYFIAEANNNDYTPKALKVELSDGIVLTASATKTSLAVTSYDPATGKNVKTTITKLSDTSLSVVENETAYPNETTWIVDGLDVAGIEKKLATKDLDTITKLAENFRDYTNGVTVTKANDAPYTPSYADGIFTVKHGDEVIFSEEYTDGTINRAKNAIKKDASVSVNIESDIDTDTTLRAWIGKSAVVTLTMECKNVDYTFVYNVNTTMTKDGYDSLVDADIQEALDIAKDVESATGISSVTYDASKNTFEVLADEDLDLSTAYAAIQKKVDAIVAKVNDSELTRTFDDLSKVTVSLTVPSKKNAQSNYEKTKNSLTLEAFINDFADSYYSTVASHASSYTDLDGAVSGFYATFDIGNTSYTLYYEVRFAMTNAALKSAFDKTIDSKIADSITEAAKDAKLQEIGSVAYDATSNTIEATFKADGTLESYKDSEIFATLKKAVLSAVSKEQVSGATLEVGNSTKTIKLDTAENMAKEVFDFLNAEGKNVSDLAAKDIALTVNFKSESGEAYDLIYNVKLAVAAQTTEAANKDADETAEEVEATVDATDVTEDTAVEAVVETETIEDVIEEVIDTPEVDEAAAEDVEVVVTEDVEEVIEDAE